MVADKPTEPDTISYPRARSEKIQNKQKYNGIKNASGTSETSGQQHIEEMFK
jgi:hypothetical protein